MEKFTNAVNVTEESGYLIAKGSACMFSSGEPALFAGVKPELNINSQ